jgi:hypothetical protein
MAFLSSLRPELRDGIVGGAAFGGLYIAHQFFVLSRGQSFTASDGRKSIRKEELQSDNFNQDLVGTRNR